MSQVKRRRSRPRKKREPSSIWMAVTADKYELPIAIGNSAQELADIFHVSRATVEAGASRYAHGKLKKRRQAKRYYVRVELGP